MATLKSNRHPDLHKDYCLNNLKSYEKMVIFAITFRFYVSKSEIKSMPCLCIPQSNTLLTPGHINGKL